MNKIYIHRGDCVVFADITDFLTFMIDSELDLTNWKAEFHLCSIIKKYDDISSKVIKIILSSEETSLLKCGTWNGALVLIDANGHRKTITNTIPFEVTKEVVENHYQTIDLTIPQSSGVDVKLKVGASTVTSVNGMTGDVVLDIPSIEGLATEKQLEDGLATKQDKGDYALREEIPSLERYVKDTDIATSEKAGIAKINLAYGININNQALTILKASDNEVKGKGNLYRPIVPANLDLAVKTGVTTNTIELSEDEKANAKAWLGYAEPTDIMQAIASIPQFNLTIVDELPETGAKMTLYLVPKDGEAPDVYNEYIWIEQTSSYEHLGTTAVDLTDYVKNTDYASANKGGVIKISSSHGFQMSGSGLLIGREFSLADYNSKGLTTTVITKGTLENIKNNYVKEGVTANDIELTDDEKTSARTWLGAVGNADYATGTIGGVIKVASDLGTQISNGYISGAIKTLSQYQSAYNYILVSKGTLENVLTQYATNETVGEIDDILDQINGGTSLLTTKAMAITEADYNALETKDSNTLYLIEE